ncbi:hypothetical protein L798_10554 [Zootermopsis nevadensis]|uniref:Uncharacterized protein n=1 Tax=Zootermopsis nevadensis TaxID=136037 RepID=A0A067R4W0_ZOONE|nr:hypothetical protein L798_10554 [Zootermopsis nevadensis]
MHDKTLFKDVIKQMVHVVITAMQTFKCRAKNLKKVPFTHLHDDPIEGGLGIVRSVSAPRGPHGDCGLHLERTLVAAVPGTVLKCKLQQQQLAERRERKNEGKIYKRRRRNGWKF